MLNNVNVKNTQYRKRTLKEETATRKYILADFDLLAIIFGSFYVSFIISLMELSIFMVAVIQFKWSLTILSIVTTCSIAISVVAMKLLQQFKENINNFFLFTLCVVSSWFVVAILFVTIQVKISDFPMQITIIFTILFISMIAGYNMCAWARCLCFSIVAENYLATVESYRLCSHCIGFCMGFLTASFAYNANNIFYPLFISGCVLEFIWLLVARKRFIS